MFGEAFVGESERVDEDEHPKLLGGGEERSQGWIGQVLAVDIGADLNAAKIKLLHAAPKLDDREFRRLQRDRAEADQPLGTARNDLGDVVVDRARGVPADIGRREIIVLRGRRRDRLHIDAEPVHVGEALVGPVQPLADARHLRAVDFACRRAGHRKRAGRRRHTGGANDGFRRWRGEVAVDVDHEMLAVPRRRDESTLVATARRVHAGPPHSVRRPP